MERKLRPVPRKVEDHRLRDPHSHGPESSRHSLRIIGKRGKVPFGSLFLVTELLVS
jgi:hypothetical protein